MNNISTIKKDIEIDNNYSLIVVKYDDGIITFKDRTRHMDINAEYNTNTNRWSGTGAKTYHSILKEALRIFNL